MVVRLGHGSRPLDRESYLSIMKPPGARYLTDDEVIGFPDGLGHEIPYRLRIWRGGRLPCPLVLVSQIIDDGCKWPEPSLVTVRLANYVNEAYLAMSENGLLYYEDEVDLKTGLRNLWRVRFEYHGHADRLRIFKARRQIDGWDAIEHFAGGPVKR